MARDDESWRWSYFGPDYARAMRRKAGIPEGLLAAPRPPTRSQARREWDEAHARAAERRRQETRRSVEHQHQLSQATPRESLDALVARFGRDTVTALMRRVDPSFSLPADVTG